MSFADVVTIPSSVAEGTDSSSQQWPWVPAFVGYETGLSLVALLE